MVAEQEAAELTGPSKKSGDLIVKSLVEYTDQTAGREMDPSVICVEHCNMNSKKTESCIYCNGPAESFELHSASDGFFEPDQTFTKCDTWGLSQPLDKRTQHCESFKSSKSSEHCANHSLASKCSPCCEHCAEQLQLFQQCEPSDQELQSPHSEPYKLEENCEGFGQCEISDFTPESTNQFELLQQYEPCECSDSEPDTSTEYSEQSEMFGFTPNLSDSTDSLDCETEVSEYEDVQNEVEFININDDDNCENKQLEEELSDEESSRLSEKTPAHVYFEDSEDVPFEANLYNEDETAEDAPIEMHTDSSEVDENEDSDTCQDYEPGHRSPTPEECNSETTSEFYGEEDSISVCSSGETKSFETCPSGSVLSEPCFDTSGESDEGTREDSGDEQTQWESFEDEEELQKCKFDDSNEDTKKTPVVDLVIEDYFDLFDRADHYHYDYTFTKKQRYTSCFDGGDIDHRLYLEEEAQKPKNLNKPEVLDEVLDEMNVQDPNICSEDEPEDFYEEIASQQSESSDLEKQSGSSLAGDEYESETQENSEGVDDDEVLFDKEACAFEGHVSEVDDEEIEVSPLFRTKESMFAPFAKEISVEGDAYEDKMNNSPMAEDTSDANCLTDDTIDEDDLENQLLIAFSEKEPYWSLLDIEENGQLSLPGVEDYFAYQIQSIPSSMAKALNELIMAGNAYNQKTKRKADTSRIKGKEDPSYLEETELQLDQVYPEDNELSTFKFTDVIDLNGFFDENEQTSEWDDECETEEISREISVPSGIIHSVNAENAKSVGRDEGTENDEADEQSRDSEEEQTDEEYYEACECEYCIPPTDQVPVEPLLPQLTSSNTGKICAVIDLDETLVHSSFKPVNNADFTIPVEIDETVHQVYVLKRPHVDEFLKRMGEMFECVLFTASLSKYADPVSDELDKCEAFQSRLFRESCVFHKGNYVKDLSRLGRDLNKVIILDNSPASYIFHPDNAVPVASWFDDTSDTELLDLIPFFERLSKADDIYDILREQRTSS